jgi:sec-independent protein translocase protein TatA
MGGLGPGELIFAFLIVLLLFGAKRLPEIGSSLGKGIREFKSSFTEIERELKVPSEHQIDQTAATPADEETGEDDQDEPRTLNDIVEAGQQQ